MVDVNCVGPPRSSSARHSVASMCDSIHHYIGGVPLMELRALDPVLKEVSTFMDLHHPYIVRYIGKCACHEYWSLFWTTAAPVAELLHECCSLQCKPTGLSDPDPEPSGATDAF